MRVEKHGNKFVVVKGRGDKEMAFGFFVDHDSSSWSGRNRWGARTFDTRKQAEEAIKELRKRARIRRIERSRGK